MTEKAGIYELRNILHGQTINGQIFASSMNPDLGVIRIQEPGNRDHI